MFCKYKTFSKTNWRVQQTLLIYNSEEGRGGKSEKMKGGEGEREGEGVSNSVTSGIIITLQCHGVMCMLLYSDHCDIILYLVIGDSLNIF